eukprot:2361649-Prymnesium_polylepis.1
MVCVPQVALAADERDLLAPPLAQPPTEALGKELAPLLCRERPQLQEECVHVDFAPGADAAITLEEQPADGAAAARRAPRGG